MSENTRVVKTYVWHGDRCWLVSTIERSSSAEGREDCRFNETIVWEYDWEKRERGEQVHCDSTIRDSICLHQQIVEAFYETGEPPKEIEI